MKINLVLMIRIWYGVTYWYKVDRHYWDKIDQSYVRYLNRIVGDKTDNRKWFKRKCKIDF